MYIDTRSLVQVGAVPVDSGQIMVVDPCYVLQGDVQFATDNNTVVSDNPYSRACAASMSEDRVAPFSTSGHMADAVCTSTAWGDGMYPVYAEYDDKGNVVRLVIDFDPSPEDYYDEDEDEDYYDEYDNDEGEV